ncbi:unnamed protein product [Owenia fusiformis]|uniref:Uncharacterized protein n=1 Tax=Owenia fusiformis TaxID=6347 RepID=A0A8J1TZA2_OWEFU|nr:unnamed protein product [Owenia fusiformis]
MTGIAECITLNNGVEMPMVGLGTFQGNYQYTSVFDVVVSSVTQAIVTGYRHLDTAFIYNTEDAVGEAIRGKIQDGTVTRKDLFVTTKLWCPYHEKDRVKECLQKSLKNLGLEYVDLYLIHWPTPMVYSTEQTWPKDENGKSIYSKTDYVETWQGMEACVASGLARSIGMSNFNQHQLQRILDNCSIIPAVLQIESNPFFTNTPLIEFCKKNTINVVAYSPLGKPYRTWDNDPEKDPYFNTNETILKLAEKYKRTPGQIMLRYQIQRGVGVVPKSNDKQRQTDNIQIFDFEFSVEDMKSLHELNRDFRILKLEPLADSPEYPFNEPYIGM